MAKKSIQIGRINYKPLNAGELSDLDPSVILRRLRNIVMRKIKKNLLQTAFSDAAKKALAKNIYAELKPSSLVIYANHPAYRPLVEGQRRRQMRWLTKSPRPIPIITETGELIFRSATPRSMANGSWVHPGRAPSNFMDKARDEARKVLKTKLKKELKKQVTTALMSGKAKRMPR